MHITPSHDQKGLHRLDSAHITSNSYDPRHMHIHTLCLLCKAKDVVTCQTHNAPTRLSMGIKDLLRWRLMTWLVPPTSSPPMKTAGTAGLQPSRERACSISRPAGISSSSWTAGLTPKSQKRDLIEWLRQHELLLNITTGLSEAIFVTLSISCVFWKTMLMLMIGVVCVVLCWFGLVVWVWGCIYRIFVNEWMEIWRGECSIRYLSRFRIWSMFAWKVMEVVLLYYIESFSIEN